MDIYDIRFINRKTKRTLRSSKKWRMFNGAVFDIYCGDTRAGYIELSDDPTGWQDRTLGIMKIEILPQYRGRCIATMALKNLMFLTGAAYIYAEITNVIAYKLFCSVFGEPIDVDTLADLRQLSRDPGFLGKPYSIDMIFDTGLNAVEDCLDD